VRSGQSPQQEDANQTQAAVRAYQARYGLPVTGLLDFETRLQLIPSLDYDKANR